MAAWRLTNGSFGQKEEAREFSGSFRAFCGVLCLVYFVCLFLKLPELLLNYCRLTLQQTKSCDDRRCLELLRQLRKKIYKIAKLALCLLV